MSLKREYLNTVRKRYTQSTCRNDKSQIINEVVQNLKVSRKHAIKTLNKALQRKKLFKRTRPERYTYDLSRPLKILWQVVGRPCSKRLKPQIPKLIEKLEQFDEIHTSEEQKKLLEQMSTFTIDRLLSYVKKRTKVKGLGGTKRSPLLKSLIPIRTNFDEVDKAGHLETDCVLHCGDTTAGVYAQTLNILDIQTHWNEKKMILRKTKTKVVGAFNELKKGFPFKVLSVDFDNGDEFVNWLFYEYCKKQKIAFTRSRPYKKNDQAHIEGKNFESIRKLIGYERIESEEIVDLVNDIYLNEHRLLTNFFYSTLKMRSKERIGSKIRKKYEVAKTPYERIVRSKEMSLAKKSELMGIYKGLNPAKLSRDLDKKLERVSKKMKELGVIFKSGNVV